MFENRIKKFRFIGTLKLLQIFGGPHASRVRVSPFLGILALLLFVATDSLILGDYTKMSPVVSPRSKVDTSMHWSRFHYIRETDLRKRATSKLLKNVFLIVDQ